MTRNRANVLTGAPDAVSGYFFAGPVMTTEAEFPTDATSALPVSLKSLGYVGEDGVSKTVNRSTEQIRDWNLDLVAVVTSEHSVQLQATFLESANAEVLKIIAGDDNVIVDAVAGTVHVKETADDLPHRAVAFEIKGNGDTSARVFSADSQASAIGDVTFAKAGIISYQVTFECYADVSGAKLHTFFDTAVTPVTP